jgi:hypothetical protein
LMRRARPLFVTALVAIALRAGLACSTSGQAAAAPGSDGGPPGEAVTACQIQGYVSELDGGSCPPGTCAVRAFDTNGGLLPCCTSVVSGPGMCLDAEVTGEDGESSTEEGETGQGGEGGESGESG